MAGPNLVFVGSDHAGFALKRLVLEHLKQKFPEIKVEDLGCHSEESVDYPDFGALVGHKVVSTPGSRGIVICGSGIGIAIAANKVAGVRAAQCWDATSARLSREHNDANIVSFGARLIGPEVALEICSTFLKTEFLGGRHEKRVHKITELEKSRGKG